MRMHKIKFAEFNHWSFYALLGSIIFVTCFISWYTYQQTKNNLSDSMRGRVTTLATALDPQMISNLHGFAGDADLSTYGNLKNKLITLHQINPDIRFIYLMSLRDGVVYFVADSEQPGSPDESPPGQAYTEASPSIYKSFATGEISLVGPETDRWGTWVSAYAPIYDTDGSIQWVVGVDTNAKTFIRSPYLFAAIPAAALIFICFALFGVTVIHAKETKIIALRNQFVSLASHELRTPLTGIRWSAEELMSDNALTPPQRSIAENIHSACIKLLAIINELLDAASIDARSFDQHQIAPVMMKEVVLEAIDHLKLFTKEKQITIRTALADDPCIVMGESSKLFNAVTNVLSNTIKYSHTGSEIIVSTQRNDDVVSLSVKDSGIGIASSDIPRVQKGFYRAENAIAHTSTGTGLGLYVTEQTIALHKGTFTIDSVVQKGTTVTITLPASRETTV